jgi:hypothetical protein
MVFFTLRILLWTCSEGDWAALAIGIPIVAGILFSFIYTVTCPR